MITLRTIISNIRKGQSAVAVRYVLKGLEEAYNELKKSIKIISLESSEGNTTIYLIVPSTKIPNLFYDVVLWLDTDSKMTLDTQFKIYSNSPSFAYNFSYVFNKADSLLMKDKYPSSFLTSPPKTRNPFETAGFDRQIFAVIRYMSDFKVSRAIKEYENKPIPRVKTFKEKSREIGDMKKELANN